MKRRLPPTPLIVLAAVVVAAVTAAILIRPDADDVEAFFDGGGAFGPVLFAAAYALLTVLLFPGAPLTIAAGALYGVAGGALVSVIGATVGATASFLISRRGTRESVGQVRGGRLEAIEARLSGRGVLALLLLRLIPVVPFNALNYAAGASAIGTRDYLVATAAGIVPGAIVYAALGTGLDDPTSPLFVVAVITALAMALAAWRVGKRQRPDAEKEPASTTTTAAPAADAPRPERDPARDPDLRRLLWASLFFLATLGGLAVLTAGGLFH